MRNAFLTATLCLSAAGCSVVPSVQYQKITQGSSTGNFADSFYLAQSVIIIEKLEQAKKDKAAATPAKIAVMSKPSEFTGFKVGIRPDSTLRVTTNVNIVKLENTDLVKSIGVETVDHTTELIGSISGVFVKAIGLVKATDIPGCDFSEAEVPIAIPIDKALSDANNGKTFGLDGKAGTGERNCIAITLSAVPPDAIEVAKLPYGVSTRNFYYSACRNAEVTLHRKDQKTATAYTVRVADPNYVQFVQFPYKGSISMHSECGVSVKTEKTGSDVSPVQIVDSVLKGIKDVADAIEK